VSSRDPRGQVLIITAFAMVVLIAIAAIVVDLGMSWMLHRREQNAVDPASLAAAKWINPTVNQAKMKAEACFYAQQNGFFVGDIGCAAALASGNLQVHSPPSSTLSGNFRGTPHYVEVIINATHPSFFGQFFGEPFGSVKTAAVAKFTTDNANSSSLVALGDSCRSNTGNDGDSTVTGGGTLTIHPATGVTTPGGYINVNAPCGGIGNPQACDGNGNSSALAITGGGHLLTPHAFIVGGCGTGGGGTFQCYPIGATGCLDEQAIPLGDPLAGLPEPWPTISLPTPACPWLSGPVNVNGPSDSSPCTLKGGNNGTCPLVGAVYVCTMNPGLYYAGWDIQSSVQVVLKPGMYVFAGFGIKMGASSSLTAVTGGTPGNPIDARVTIFSTDYTQGCLANKPNFCEGDITINSAGPLRLKATDKTTCQQVSPAICPWTGILLWEDGTTVNTPGIVTISGQSDLVLSGTIYAPKSLVKISGGSNGTGCSGSPQTCLAIQIIARQWVISGGGVIDMPYNPADLYPILGQGLVH
jgi:hypothetical protein